jgi:hypothetical protein
VEAASRALFLIRFGRPRDADLDALLAKLNITRLTPEARASIEAYAETSPTAQAMLGAVPPSLTVYAALRPIPPPAAIADAAIAGALPWLPLVAEATTALDLPADMPTTAIPEEAPPYGTAAPTSVTPVAEPWQYGEQPSVEEREPRCWAARAPRSARWGADPYRRRARPFPRAGRLAERCQHHCYRRRWDGDADDCPDRWAARCPADRDRAGERNWHPDAIPDRDRRAAAAEHRAREHHTRGQRHRADPCGFAYTARHAARRNDGDHRCHAD